jgi:DNA-binding response OmpR family regulator
MGADRDVRFLPDLGRRPALPEPGGGGRMAERRDRGPTVGSWPGEIATIVLCDGDAAILDPVSERLAADRFRTLPTSSGADALRICGLNRPNILVLGLLLPDIPGIDLLRQIRGAGDVDTTIDPDLPVIVLGQRGEGAAQAESRQLGADAFIQKPFTYEELKERIDAVRRRHHSRQDPLVRYGDLVVDPGRRRVTVAGREVHLAKMEFALLRVLATDPTRVFGKDELLGNVWGPDRKAGTRTLDSHASRLRRKLDPEKRLYVINCWGVGYSLVAR